MQQALGGVPRKLADQAVGIYIFHVMEKVKARMAILGNLVKYSWCAARSIPQVMKFVMLIMSSYCYDDLILRQMLSRKHDWREQ